MTIALADREVRTERLLLRRYREGDLDRLMEIQPSPEVARFLYWEPGRRAEVEPQLAKRIAGTRLENDDDVVTLAVERLEEGLLLGEATIFLRNIASRQVEIGYVFHPDAGGKGYATEARALVDLAFDDLDAHRVFARTDARNTASAALLRVGILADEWSSRP